MFECLKKRFQKPIEPVPELPKSEVQIPIEQKNGAGLDWYPKGIVDPKLKMKTKGKYAGGYPRGAVVHFTAGRYEGGVKKSKDTILGGIKNGYTFLCISYDGYVVQAHPISEWGYHAGESAWKNVAKQLVLSGSVSDDLIGIEINNAGKLTKVGDLFKTWFGTYIPPHAVRYVEEKDYGCPTGYYHKYTPEQEETLVQLLVWLKRNDPTGKFSFDHVLGHHEVAGKRGIGYFRKNDPGGALSMSMDAFREHLKQLDK